uniref:Major facilitator superfamily (MFS) profile domain-containing protein n=1 Tax=Bionectria ochroleuca TaxID=29856 RepID=A0A8H7K4R9_BIOOC
MTPKSDAEHVDIMPVQEELANIANQEEHDLGKLESIKKYPLAFLWSLYAVWCVLLVSFENQASGNIIGVPEFRKDFGRPFEGVIGIVGALGCGAIADWLGRRATIIICLVITYAAITMEFVATTNELFFGGKFLNGFAVGALASVTVSYIGEVAPLALRGFLTCLSALAYTLGPFVVALIVNWTGTYENRWAYRAVFCAQYGFAAIATVFVPFMPESPWWLASVGKSEKALQALNRLGQKGEDGEKRLAAINQTLEEIKRETEGASYLNASESIVFVASYSTYYIQLAGFSTEMSFKLQIVQQVISLIGNVMSWFLVDKVGRRALTFWGLVVLTIILFLTGGLAVAGTPGAIKGTVALILIYCWWYNVTIGATAYTVLVEVSTARLRVKTIAIGLATQSLLNMIWSFVLPLLFNPDKANLSAKLAFIFGGFAVFSLVFLWFYHPETADRTYEELDEMFVKKVPARKFKDFKTDTQAVGEAVKAQE